ncbi:ABC-2 family transporter protein [Pirellulimonas nuda]|uniref:ABC-2 family transporter protein n=1 Tax=Pirellulimonas nuda TaxID=2528009 RepID=A0A518DFB0_9BACT|nr:ABC transporter permease subunit [Pirellulimonas nuda]QDU90159.1 ABC-2 family transporter protein [Pirellulimonas nuda]
MDTSTLQLWITPLWIVAAGVTLGVAVLALLWGLAALVSRKAGAWITSWVTDGPLAWVSAVAGVWVTLFLIGLPVMPVREVASSMARIGSVGERTETVPLEPRTEDEVYALQNPFVAAEVKRYEFQSDQDLRVAVEKGVAYDSPVVLVQGDEPYVWTPASKRARGFEGAVDTLYITNESDLPAELTISLTTELRTPEARDVLWAAGAVITFYLSYLLIASLLRGTGIVALATAKEAMGQPLYLLLLIVGAVAMVAFVYIPYNTFGEDVKMLKDSGRSLIMVFGIVFALWTASVSVADEIEGKTALTLLSKPISRRQFILGKFLGIVWPVVVMFVILGGFLMAAVSYKVVYDSRESSNPTPNWQECNTEMIRTVPVLTLALMETIVLASISLAISTRLPMLPNLIIVGTIYVLGHLTPLVAQSSVGKNEFVSFFGRLSAVVLPVLDHFNVEAATVGARSVPLDYLLWAGVYCLLFVTIAMLVALTLFEDRDLA